MAGRVGCGGGPFWLRRVFFPLRRAVESEVLKKSQRHHHHHSMVVQTMPAPTLEVIETKLLFHLLVALLADPSGLDQGSQDRQGRVRRQVAEIVLNPS